MVDEIGNPNSGRMMRTIVAASFLTALGVGMLSFAVPLVSLDERVSGAWLGTGFAGFFLARLLAGPLGGMWSDRGGARTPLLTGCFAGAIAPVLYLVHPSIPMLYAIQFILGVVSGLIRPVGLAVLGSVSPAGSVHRWFSAHVLAFNAAMFTGPLVGGVLYWNRTVEPLLVGLALCMAIAHSILFMNVPPGTGTWRHQEHSLDDTGGRPNLAALLIAVFGRTFGIGVFVAFYPVLLSRQLGMHGLTLGILFATPAFMTFLCLLLERVVKWERDGHFLVWGMALSALGLMLGGISRELWQFAGAGILMGFGAALSIPESMRVASAVHNDQGRVFGLTHVVTGSGFVAGPLVGGFIIQATGRIEAAFVLAGLVGWFCLLAWDRYDGWSWGRYDSWKKWMLARTVPAVIILAAMVGTVLFFRQGDKAGNDELYSYTEMAMGTVVSLTLEARSQKAADDAARKAFAYMRTVQKDLDYRNPNGSVGRINGAAGKRYVVPSRWAYALIRRSVAFSERTGGVFDPTIGALTTSPLYYVLDKTIAAAKKDLVDYRLVSFDETMRRIRLDRAGMALDLGGIAKGTIIDGTVNVLKALGIQAGIVEAGGDFYCFGEKVWTVGVRHPRDDEMHATLSVREQGVCGSGDYEQFVEVEEKGESTLVHHIIDPKEMVPATHSIGVTVLAESAELADALSTTLFIMGPDKGISFVGTHYPDAAAIWFAPDRSVTTTSNFPK